MKLKEILTEASSLNQYGVSQGDIGRIHRALKLKHDVTYEPIRNKILAKSAISKEGRVIIAVNSAGEAFGIGPWKHEFSGAYLVMMTTPGKSGDVVTITDAFKAVSGPGWKYFVSTSRRASQDKYDRSVGSDYGQPFINDTQKRHGTFIQAKAQEAYDAIKSHLMDIVAGIDDEDQDINPSDLKHIKTELKVLKNIAEKGIAQGSINSGKGTAMLADFFGGGYAYELDSMTKEWQRDQKLGTQKFAKYVANKFAEKVKSMTTGSWNKIAQNAQDYKTTDGIFGYK